MVQIVDTATLIYEDKNLDIQELKENIENILGLKPLKEKEIDKIVFRVQGQNGFRYINFISLIKLRKNIRISITFSYSRYKSNSNYELCDNEKTVNKINSEIAKLFKLITLKPITVKKLKVSAIDISNQLEVENIRSYYKCNDLIYRALRQTETNGRLYFDTAEDRRKVLDGLDFREQNKKRREANSYFKIYSKRKEEEQTGKQTKGHTTALRGELTLKGAFLKRQGLEMAEGINRNNLDRILYNTLANVLAEGIEKELSFSITHLAKLLQENGTRKIRELLIINEHHIFDAKILDIILTPEILGVSDRQCRTYKKQVKEILQVIENSGEIKKVFTGNFERLTKLIKKVVKAEMTFNFTEKGVVVKWEKLQSKQK